MDVMNSVDFQTQLTSIMETMAKTAVAEISKLLEENSLFLRLEISRRARENDALLQKCQYLETELQAARKNAVKMDSTGASFPHSELTDTGHQPAVDSVFGKEWSMNMWRREEAVGPPEDDHVHTAESPTLLHEKPDMVLIKEEMFEDCYGRNKTEEEQRNSLRGPDVRSNERCVAESSADLITYTMSSDDQVRPDIQQRQAEEQAHDARLLSHGDGTTELNFNTTQNKKSNKEEKRFECVFCGRAFNKLSYLKTHMRTHSGEKPFACTVCGRRFAQKTYLRIHQRIHSGERPYTCMDCGKGFAQKSALNVHLRSHTGEKPYSCVECGKSYKYKQDFNTHPCVRLIRSAVNDF